MKIIKITRQKTYAIAIIVKLFIFSSSCGDSNDASILDVPSNTNTTLLSSSQIASRITELSEKVEFEPSSYYLSKKEKNSNDDEEYEDEYETDDSIDSSPNHGKADELDYEIIAQIDEPQINGSNLTTSSITINKDLLAVSYMSLEDEYSGGVDIFSIKEKSKPKLVESFLTPNHDIVSLQFYKSELFIVGGRSDYTTYPAFLGVLKHEKGKIKGDFAQRELESYMGTDIFVKKGRIYASSGDRGGIQILDRTTRDTLHAHYFEDARSVIEEGNYYYLLTGQPGQIHKFDKKTEQHLETFAIGGISTPEDKTIFQMAPKSNKLLIAKSDQGFAIACKDSLKVVANVESFSGENLDYSPNYSLNLSTMGQYLFSASGGNGVQVYDLGKKWYKKCSDLDVKKIGRIYFKDQSSVTHIAIIKNYIFVATAEKGLRIIKFNTKK